MGVEFKIITVNNTDDLIMEKLTIETWQRKNYTFGVLRYKSFECVTLELPWLNNQKDISCIPRGTYVGRKHESPANGSCISIENVLDREFIQIHALNWLHQTKGCIGVGKSFKPDSDRGPMITSSKSTLKELLDLLPDKFIIELL